MMFGLALRRRAPNLCGTPMHGDANLPSPLRIAERKTASGLPLSNRISAATERNSVLAAAPVSLSGIWSDRTDMIAEIPYLYEIITYGYCGK